MPTAKSSKQPLAPAASEVEAGGRQDAKPRRKIGIAPCISHTPTPPMPEPTDEEKWVSCKLARAVSGVCAVARNEWEEDLAEIENLPARVKDEAFSIGRALAFLRDCLARFNDAMAVAEAGQTETENAVAVKMLGEIPEDRRAAETLCASAFFDRCKGAAMATKHKSGEVARRCRDTFNRVADRVERLAAGRGDKAHEAGRSFRQVLDAESREDALEAAIALATSAADDWRKVEHPVAAKTRKPNKGGRPTKDKECELTQEEAAMIVKESVSTIRNWDNGKHRPLGYPGRRDAAAFKLWANERDGKRELKESIKKASSLDNPRNPYSRMK